MLRIEGVEADDVIGTLAQHAAAAGFDVVISTGDKDMAQLVDGRITLVNTMTDSRLDRAGVKAKFDVYPEQIVDYLALVGDSSDNIPGVPKVGAKTAAKWLNQYSTLDALLAHRDEIEGKVGESLRAAPERRDAVAAARNDPRRPRASREAARAHARRARRRAAARAVLRGSSCARCSPAPCKKWLGDIFPARRSLPAGAVPVEPATAQIDDLRGRPSPRQPARSRFPGRYETILTEAALEAMARTAARRRR